MPTYVNRIAASQNNRIRIRNVIFQSPTGRETLDEVVRTTLNLMRTRSGDIVLARSWVLQDWELSKRKLIGRGRYGQVVKGKLNDDADVAMYHFSFRLGARTINAFEEEVGLLYDLNSLPHVLPLLGARMVDSRPCLVFSLMPGGTLCRLLDSSTCITTAFAVRILAQIASGLRNMHSAGNLHGSLRCSSVFFERDNSWFSAIVASRNFVRYFLLGSRVVPPPHPTLEFSIPTPVSVHLPTLLSHTTMGQSAIGIIKNYLEQLMEFLVQNQTQFFDPASYGGRSRVVGLSAALPSPNIRSNFSSGSFVGI
ncbi:kinase-like domain-containing protein [Blyttiomyces helicus]|uniref:Kinase-like domain-containing protein n=1 Tax=Blyttiomyces helicus TaxID=388810 RepID=A0A4P9WLK2_9FUNG|nr:kinase-like domain-containing protein [Blyttiomyces helicus]|eukprot:RKO93921.1 kinase-like domain-containing protein [Blyttiomyces helicus]